jgi:asparagine synthase (glutamine-hydrolysing)
MCGFAGFVAIDGARIGDARAVAHRMIDTIVHRGPDAGDVWLDSDGAVALGHRRLSIIELSAAGAQPMQSRSGNLTLVYNGEIYNHLDIREALGFPQSFWRGHSDTETLLAAIEEWGIERALQAAVGMFAFALWNADQRTLTLARDRMGEKPAYYGFHGGQFLFGSELKALRVHPSFRADVDVLALGDYFRFGNMSGTATIWKNIKRLVPGTWIEVEIDQHWSEPQPRPYWSASQALQSGLQNPFRGGQDAALEQLDTLMRRAVGRQMLSDVPLGALLSGGIDSSAVVAYMQDVSSGTTRTYSIGFEEAKYDESAHAERVAQHLQTDHKTLIVTASDAQSQIPRLAEIFDEPFGDSSAIPTLLVSRMARADVTVALTGDGADELFGGYSRYLDKRVRYLNAVFPYLPTPLLGSLVARYAPGVSRTASNRREMFVALYEASLTHWRTPPLTSVSEHLPSASAPGNNDLILTMMMHDIHNYLPNDILTKVDRTGMSVSLESRAPFLDHQIVEFALSLPANMRTDGNTGKKLLRELLYRKVPQSLVDRPKSGFALPIESWISGPLRDWAEDLLSETSLADSGLLTPAPIRQRWSEHLSGRHNHRDALWIALMFQSWWRANKP